MVQSQIWLVLTGQPNLVPGWYLHILVAPLSFAAAVVLARAGTMERLLTALAIAYGFAFSLACMWLQALLYSGCAVKLGDVSDYRLPDQSCLFDMATLEARMRVLSHPHIALVALAAAVLAGLGVFTAFPPAWRAARQM